MGLGAGAAAAPTAVGTRELLLEPRLIPGRPGQPPVLGDEAMTKAEVAPKLSMNKGSRGWERDEAERIRGGALIWSEMP